MKSTEVPDEVLMSMHKIIEMFYADEERHWEEEEKPTNHIFNDLELVGRFLENLN